LDTNVLIPILAAVAVVAVVLALRRTPSSNAASGPSDRTTSKTEPAHSGKARPKQSASGAKTPAANPKAPIPFAPDVPRLEEEGDLDITIIKAVTIAELTAETAPADGEDDQTERSGKRKLSKVEVMYEDEADLEEITAPVARILISASGDSDQGLKRPRNEDSFLVFPERSLFAVADGMGGYRGGEVASTLAIDTVRHAFESGIFEGKVESTAQVPKRGHELACAMQMANQAILAMAKLDPELSQMGTTLVAARFSPNKQRVYIGHVGDSRCYRLRGNVLRQLTTDHTLGSLGVKGAHAKELFQAMGVKPSVTIDLIVDKPREDDIYLLCSDGLSKMLSDEDIRSVLLGEADLEAAVYGLIEQANDRGGRDNTTLILVKVVARVPRDLAGIT
jgi:serine/threonine protein phosphatase PrpC